MTGTGLLPGLKLDFSTSPTADASAQRPPAQFIEASKYPGGFQGIFSPNSATQHADTSSTVLGATPPPNTNTNTNTNNPAADSRMQELGKIGSSRNPAQEAEYQSLVQQLQNSAQSGQQATLSAIQKRLDETRNQANQQIQNATGTRDYIMDFINKRYPELTQRVEQQRANELQDLGTQQTDLTSLYDRANAQARRRSEDAALQNRMSARAGNRLGSSFYDELVANNQESLGKTLGASDLERIGKMAAIGTQKTRTNQNFDNTVNDLETQKSQASYQAMDEYKKEVQAAEALSRAGVLDFGESEAQAAQNLQSKLDSIAQWAQGMASQKQALDAQYGSNGSDGSVGTALSSFAGANSAFLSGNAGTPAGNATQNYQANVMGAPTQSSNNTANLISLAGRQKPLTLQDILAGATA
jgi:hypothetical protein